MNHYIIPSDNWEQQRVPCSVILLVYYIIPSDNWEQQLLQPLLVTDEIISYQAITGNNNGLVFTSPNGLIISYQAITGNNNTRHFNIRIASLYHTKR